MLIHTKWADLDTIRRTAALLEAATELLSVGRIAWNLLEEIPRPVAPATHDAVQAHRKIFLTEMEHRCYAALNALKGK